MSEDSVTPPLEIFGAGAVAAPPPPQAATASAASGITTALAGKVMDLLRVMSLLRLAASTLTATSGYRTWAAVQLSRLIRDNAAST
jgi:hypothetical protein